MAWVNWDAVYLEDSQDPWTTILELAHGRLDQCKDGEPEKAAPDIRGRGERVHRELMHDISTAHKRHEPETLGIDIHSGKSWSIFLDCSFGEIKRFRFASSREVADYYKITRKVAHKLLNLFATAMHAEEYNNAIRAKNSQARRKREGYKTT